eukprot:771008-Alexandrium_andersonii.AAC.1
MSASLVGSEMCIRDRLCTPPAAGVAGTGAARLRRLGLRVRLLAPPPGPVSYTHLTLPTICSV